MKVVLKRNFFAGNGQRFRKSVNKWDVRDIPDAICFAPDGKRLLPRDAVIIDGPVEPAPREPEGNLLRDNDVDRAAADAASKAAGEVEQEDAAADFRRKLALEKAAEDAEASAPVTKKKTKG